VDHGGRGCPITGVGDVDGLSSPCKEDIPAMQGKGGKTLPACIVFFVSLLCMVMQQRRSSLHVGEFYGPCW